MLRKCMLALALAVTIVTPLALPTAAQADDTWNRWHDRHFGARFHHWHGFAPGVSVYIGTPSVSYGYYPYGYTYYSPYGYTYDSYRTYVDAYGRVVYSPAPGPYPYYNRY